MSQGRSFTQLLRDRIFKTGFYDSPKYWDMKAQVYEGLARSCWPSNVFNRHWDARQMEIVDRLLGDVRGLDIVDIACGTGRASRHLAKRGAKVTGLDFSPLAIEAAKRESEGYEIDYRQYDILAKPDEDLLGHFDIALVIGCLAVACTDDRDLDRGLSHIAGLLRKGGRALFLEPIHESRLLRRILRMSESDYVERCKVHGLRLVLSEKMGLLPVRFAFAFRDMPEGVVGSVFWKGEKLLDSARWLKPLADYSVLLFQKA